jgi:purine-binding chemotaxis protein CheW
LVDGRLLTCGKWWARNAQKRAFSIAAGAAAARRRQPIFVQLMSERAANITDSVGHSGAPEEAAVSVILIFRCGERRCALDRAAVSEVAPLPELSRPPGMPASLEGFLNLGGDVLGVVDAASLFGLAPDDSVDPIYRHLVVLAGREDERFCLLVDRVEDVRTADLSALQAAPAASTLNGCVAGQLEIDGAVVHVLAADRILLAAEAARMEALRAAEQARLDALGAA